MIRRTARKRVWHLNCIFLSQFLTHYCQLSWTAIVRFRFGTTYENLIINYTRLYSGVTFYCYLPSPSLLLKFKNVLRSSNRNLSFFNGSAKFWYECDTSFTRSYHVHPIHILNIIFWPRFFCPTVQLTQTTTDDVIDALATNVGVA